MSDPFGHSLAMADGDLVPVGDGLLETSGHANLRQALTLRILTPAGTDVFDTSYGFDARAVFSHPGVPAVIRELIKLELVKTLSGDPRVREVTDVDVPDDLAATRRAWRVDVTIATVAGGTQRLSASLGA